tara:strand:+ start:5136 stop:5531 length:396 start_codon:yes stop_codon:yes gene_type:complete
MRKYDYWDAERLGFMYDLNKGGFGHLDMGWGELETATNLFLRECLENGTLKGVSQKDFDNLTRDQQCRLVDISGTEMGPLVTTTNLLIIRGLVYPVEFEGTFLFPHEDLLKEAKFERINQDKEPPPKRTYF